MQPEKKLARLINPSKEKTLISSKLFTNSSTKTLISVNNRSISHMILLSKTQNQKSVSQSFSQKNLKNFSKNPINKYSSSEIVKSLARNKLKEDKEQNTNQLTLHYDISHHLNRPYFKTPRNVSTSPQINVWSSGNRPFTREFPLQMTESFPKTKENFIFQFEKTQKNPLLDEKADEKIVEKFLEENIVKKNEQDQKIDTSTSKFLEENFEFKLNKKINKTKGLLKNKPTDHLTNKLQDSSKTPTAEDYIQSLRKQIPLAFTDHNTPSSRLELALLKNWLEFTKGEIQQNFSEKELENQKKFLYEIIFLELKRQMSCSCVETGELLKDLWEYQKNSKEKETSDFEKAKHKEISSIKRGFIEKISLLEEKCQEKEKIIGKKDDLYEELLIEMTTKEKFLFKTQENEHQLITKLSEMRKTITFMKKKISWLNKENENLLLKVQKKEILSENPIKPEEISSEEEETDEKILLEIKENEREEHNFQDLNQIIVASIPEVKEIHRFLCKETEITNEFQSRFTKEAFCQSELCLMDKMFEKTLKKTKDLEEMCQDYQYKIGIRDMNSKKFRQSAIIHSSFNAKMSFSGLEDHELKKNKPKIFNENSNNFPQEKPLKNEENSQDLNQKNVIIYDNSEENQLNSQENSINASFISSESFENLSENEKPHNSLLFSENPHEETSFIKKNSHINSPLIIITNPSERNEFEEKVRIRPSNASSIDMDFEKVIDLFKAENVKALDFEEKYKRNVEMLQMENAQRKKLEAKNYELSKHLEGLQSEFEKLKKIEENVRKMSILEKKRKEKLTSKEVPIEEMQLSMYKKKRKAIEKALKTKESPRKGPNLGKHVSIEYEHQKQNLGWILLEKIKCKKMSKFHNFMHLKLILKQIHMIYFERIAQMKENPLLKEQDFASYTYSFFLSLFGLKKIADKRFIILILSIKKHLSFFRVNLFARFLGLLDPIPLNYNIDELNKYSEALDFVCNSINMGTTINNNESDTKFYVPYIRAIQYTGLFGDTRMTIEENNELKKEIESFKENDPKNLNRSGIIDFDLFIEKILAKYKILVNRAKTSVINAFAACDLDGNKMCNLQEFILLNRHIESEGYEEEKVEKIFLANADIEKNGEKNLSFDKFSVISVEYNLFTDEAQDRYLGIKKKIQIEVKMQELVEVWKEKKNEIEKRFERLGIISLEEKENWKNIIKVLDGRIMGIIKAELKPTLIAYMILEKESKRLEEAERNYVEEDDDLEGIDSGSGEEDFF